MSTTCAVSKYGSIDILFGSRKKSVGTVYVLVLFHAVLPIKTLYRQYKLLPVKPSSFNDTRFTD